MRLLLLVAAVAVTAAGTASALTPIAKTTPAGTLKAEIATFNAKNYAAAYTAYTARFKASCPYATFRKHIAAQRAQLPAPLAIKMTGTRIVGAKAYLAYDILLNGTVVDAVKASKPDLFVRIKGLWYDEVDSQTVC